MRSFSSLDSLLKGRQAASAMCASLERGYAQRNERKIMLSSAPACHTICTPDPCCIGRKAARIMGFPGGQWSPISHPKPLPAVGTARAPERASPGPR